MKKIHNHIKKLFRLSISTIVGVTLLLTPFGVAHAQYPGINGRILWAAPNGHYSIFEDGSDINNSTVPVETSSDIQTKWGAVYKPNGGSIQFIDTCNSLPNNIGIWNIINTHASPATEVHCPIGSPDTNIKKVFEPAMSLNNLKTAYVVHTNPHGDVQESKEIHIYDGSTNTKMTSNITPANCSSIGNSLNPVWGKGNNRIFFNNGLCIQSISSSTAGAPYTTATVEVNGEACRLNDIDPSTGDKLLYITAPNNECNTHGQLATWDIVNNARTIIAGDGTTEDYVGGYYSPDGTKIVAVKITDSGSGDAQLVTMDADGSNETIIPNVSDNGGPGVLNKSTAEITSRSFRPFWSTDQTRFGESPTCTLSASPSTINSGSSSVLSWTTNNADSITIDNGVGAVTPVAGGGKSVSPVTTTTYTATVLGPGGEPGNCSTTITVTNDPPPAPTCTMTPTPSTIGVGGSSALAWTTTNATAITIDTVTAGTDVSVNPVASGSVTVTPAATRVYTCKVTGPGGTGTGTATITVTNAPASPSCTLTADPASITSGESSFLTWTSTNATSMSINQDIGTVTPVGGGEVEVAPTATTTYTATVTGSGQTTGGCSATVTIPTTSGGGSLANAGGNLASGGLAGLLILGSVYALNSEEIRRRLRKAAKKA